MIDTDKYNGHTSDWKWIDINEQDDFYLHSEHGDIINNDTPDGNLAKDAPLLLAEVKRLQRLEQGHIKQVGRLLKEAGKHSDEVKRLREVIKNINGWVMCKDTDEIKLNCIRSQLECPSLKEVIE